MKSERATADATSDVNDRLALADLDQLYRRPLTQFLRRRMSDEGAIQDIVQDVFVRLLRMRDVHRIENLRSYLFRAAMNVLHDRNRSEGTRRRMHRGLALSQSDVVEFPVDRTLMGREAVSALTNAIGRLPERTKTIFVLRAFEEISAAEIARQIGISRRAVEKHHAKALVLIKIAMKEYCDV